MTNYKQHVQEVSETRGGGEYEVWDLTKIQSFLDISESTAKRLVLEEGFPAPIVNKERNRRWLAGAVLVYLVDRSNRGEQASPKLKNQISTFDYMAAKLVG